MSSQLCPTLKRENLILVELGKKDLLDLLQKHANLSCMYHLVTLKIKSAAMPLHWQVAQFSVPAG